MPVYLLSEVGVASLLEHELRIVALKAVRFRTHKDKQMVQLLEQKEGRTMD